MPIFELPAVLLPGELMPLHIFEERYKLMVARCLESQEPFGIVFRDSDGARRVGCEARVAEVTERFDDGRLNIVVEGGRPFKVLERFDEAGYPGGEVEPLAEPVRPEPSAEADIAHDAFAGLVERVSGEPPDRAQIDAENAYGIAARVELPAETKQALLELRSENDRMRVLGDALGALIGALERSEEVAERASMNGKVYVG